MGYSTEFEGALDITPAPTLEFTEYINRFSNTRRMERDNKKLKKIVGHELLCFKRNPGSHGEYYAPASADFGQEKDLSITNYNCPPPSQPSLWCQWVIKDNKLCHNGVEKFYEYIPWLEYLIKHFFAPEGYKLNGEISWQGENSFDKGKISVKDNIIETDYY